MRQAAEGLQNLLFFTFIFILYLLSLRAFGMALAIPHSTSPGNNW